MWCSTPYTEAPGEDGQLAEKIGASNKSHIRAVVRQIAALTFDKRECLKKVKDLGVPVAKSFLFDKGDVINIDAIEKKVGLPCFVKPNSSGSSYGIVKAYKKRT